MDTRANGWSRNRCIPHGVKVENSFIAMPDLPGIGFESKSNPISVMRELSD